MEEGRQPEDVGGMVRKAVKEQEPDTVPVDTCRRLARGRRRAETAPLELEVEPRGQLLTVRREPDLLAPGEPRDLDRGAGHGILPGRRGHGAAGTVVEPDLDLGTVGD